MCSFVRGKTVKKSVYPCSQNRKALERGSASNALGITTSQFGKREKKYGERTKNA